MIDNSYEIAVSVKVPGGWHSFGCFQVGYDKDKAAATFDSLESTSEGHDAALRRELFEYEQGAECPLIAQKGCTLDEFAVNTRIIARDVFKYFNLE